MSSSRRSSNQGSTSSQNSAEHFSIKKYGSSISIVFLLIVIGVLSYFLWSCKKVAKAAVVSAASSA
jgi:hypothetical protein